MAMKTGPAFTPNRGTELMGELLHSCEKRTTTTTTKIRKGQQQQKQNPTIPFFPSSCR